MTNISKTMQYKDMINSNYYSSNYCIYLYILVLKANNCPKFDHMLNTLNISRP